MRYILIVLMVLLLCSCSHTDSVLIPVATKCPAPTMPDRPVLRIKALTVTDTPDTVIQAYVLDLADVIGYATRLETLLKAYK